MSAATPVYTDIPPLGIARLVQLGFPTTRRLVDLPVTVRLALLFTADFEAAYGDSPAEGWDELGSRVQLTIPDRVLNGVEAYCAATRASVADLIEESEKAVARIAARVPAGCFCSMMDGRGCLTCTCPDCGAVGRFGAPIIHRGGCA